MDGDDHSLLGLPYPRGLIRHVFHRPRHRQHSSRRRWGRTPADLQSATDVMIDFTRTDQVDCAVVDATEPQASAGCSGAVHTSGKVPLEKTLETTVISCSNACHCIMTCSYKLRKRKLTSTGRSFRKHHLLQ